MWFHHGIMCYTVCLSVKVAACSVVHDLLRAGLSSSVARCDLMHGAVKMMWFELLRYEMMPARLTNSKERILIRHLTRRLCLERATAFSKPKIASSAKLESNESHVE